MGDRGKIILGGIFVIVLFVGALIFAGQIENSENVKEFISSFGSLGILIIAVLSGFNLFVPIPATAFIPIFFASGFSLGVIILMIVIGTTIADLLGFYIGTVLKPHINKRKNKIYRFIKKWCKRKSITTQIIVFLWAALVPIPNEVLLIPLGAFGVKLKTILLAFLTGNIVHVSLLSLGLTSLI